MGLGAAEFPQSWKLSKKGPDKAPGHHWEVAGPQTHPREAAGPAKPGGPPSLTHPVLFPTRSRKEYQTPVVQTRNQRERSFPPRSHGYKGHMGTQQVGSLLSSDDSWAGVLVCECEFPPWPQSPNPVTTPWHLPGGLWPCRWRRTPAGGRTQC